MDETISVDLTQVETLLAEGNETLMQLQESAQTLHNDAQIVIASLWLLCGVVVGVAVGLLVYKLWRS